MPPEQKLDEELIDRTDVEFSKVPAKDLAEREEGVPDFKEKYDLTEEQIKRLRKEIFSGMDRIQKRWEEKNMSSLLEECEAQYDGEMSDDAGLEFSFDTGVTKTKCDSLETFAVKAFLESDPKFAVTPRPKMAKIANSEEILAKQADYLDYKFDEEIKVEGALRKVCHQAITMKGGVMKIPYVHTRKKRKREEHANGKVVFDDQGQASQPGVVSFLQKYPDAINPGADGHWVYKELLKGEDREIYYKVDYNEVTYNDPMPIYVDKRNFLVDPDCEGYDGLCEERLYIEKIPYTWWELKRAEHNGDFENVDDCKHKYSDDGEKDESSGGTQEGNSQDEDGDHRGRPYTVLECNYSFNTETDPDNENFGSDDPNTEVRLLCWFEENSRAFLGAVLYPYDGVDCYYVPFYITDRKPGWFKDGLPEVLKDDHLAQNAMMNLMLTEVWQELTTTPIVPEGSPIADQFISKRWKPGVPLEIPLSNVGSVEDYLSFVPKTQRAVAGQLMNMLLFLSKVSDDKSRISSLASGKESPVDPQAPASKTAMLLEQSGINISDFISCLLPSFNLIGEITLQLTYQMSREGRVFRQKQRADRVVGGDPFASITRDEMVAKTNIQSRAIGFAFDKINEKKEMIVFWQAFRNDPIFNQNPEGILSLARAITMSWHPTLKNKVDQLFPTPEQFQAKQLGIVIQALQMYLASLSKQSQTTGVQPKPDVAQFMQMATAMLQQAVNPPPEEAQK